MKRLLIGSALCLASGPIMMGTLMMNHGATFSDVWGSGAATIIVAFYGFSTGLWATPRRS